MSSTTAQPAIGFINRDHQRLPMATTIAEAHYHPWHVWARRSGSSTGVRSRAGSANRAFTSALLTLV